MNDTKHFILRTAFMLFLKKGYNAVSMNELVKETNLTKGAFYHYFPSKEALYQETMENFFFVYLREYLENLPAKETLREALDRFFRYYFETHKDLSDIVGTTSPNLSFHLFLVDGANRDEVLKNKMIAFFEGYRKHFENVIIQAIKDKEIKPDLDPLYLSRHILSLYDGMFLLASFVSTKHKQDNESQCPMDIQDIFQNMINQFYSLLRL